MLKAILIAVLANILTAHAGYAASLSDIRRYASITTPVGKGPFPTLFLVPGCGGFSSRYRDAQIAWAKRGLMSIRIDLQSANDAPSCRELNTDDAIANVIKTIEYYRHKPSVKVGAVNLMGISWGGAVALAAMSNGLKIDATVVLFPACKFTKHLGTNTGSETPVLVIHGEVDVVAPVAACQKSFAMFPNLRLSIFPGAPHSFIGMPQFPAETKKARRQYWEFFRR